MNSMSDFDGALRDGRFSVMCPFCGNIIPVRLTKTGMPFLWCAGEGILIHFRGRGGLRTLGRRMFESEEVGRVE